MKKCGFVFIAAALASALSFGATDDTAGMGADACFTYGPTSRCRAKLTETDWEPRNQMGTSPAKGREAACSRRRCWRRLDEAVLGAMRRT